MITLFGIPNCDTVKKARKWLEAHNVVYQFHDFRKDGLTAGRLTDWCQHVSWEVLLNRRGTTWRQLDDAIKDKIDKTDKKSAGDYGERKACEYIKKNGYRVIEKNFRTRFGEIDLIATDGDTLCFIEVKARSSADYGTPEEFVTKRKQDRLWRTASIYIDKNSPEIENYRFDVVAVYLDNDSLKIFKNAFQPDGGF